MALARIKTWIAGDVLTAADLNAEFNNLLNNPISLISPTTAAINFNLSAHTNLVPNAISATSGTAGQVLTNSSALATIWAAAASFNPTVSLDPAAAVFTSADFPALVKSTAANFPKYTLAYDPTTRENASWYVYLSTNITVPTTATVELYIGATSSGGTSVWGINTKALTSGVDVESLGSTAVTSTFTSVTSTQVNRASAGIAATSWATPCILQIRISRLTTDAGDTSTGDHYLYQAGLKITL